MNAPMTYVSTRAGSGDGTPGVSISAAIAAGLAPDGGLYIPAVLPPPRALAAGGTLAGTAHHLLAPFFEGDPLASDLEAICNEAFDFPAPLHPLSTPGDYVLELFHGPTAAFKDFGARFLAAALSRVRARDPDPRPLTIVVATSGDTGAAVAAAFHRRPRLAVVVLYPDGRVAPRQAHQLGCFGDNVTALKVAGNFDDCQAMAKAALADTALQARVPLSSANSISLGRLLPQMAYYAHAALVHRDGGGGPLNLVIPTGNLGNGMAAILAKRLGVPLGEIVLASNANDVLPQFFAGQPYTPRATIATLANAMDVGAPSNFERLRWLHGGDDSAVRAAYTAHGVDDGAIVAAIERHAAAGYVACPHTAAALHVLDRLRAGGAAGDWAVAGTAHPAKFDSVVEPLAGPVAVPLALRAMLDRPAQAQPLAAEYAALEGWLAGAGCAG